MNFTILFHIVGGVVLSFATWLLIEGALKKSLEGIKNDLNPAGFLIRATSSTTNCILNIASLQHVLHDDYAQALVKSSVMIVSSISLTIIFTFACKTGRWKKVGWIEVICLVSALTIGIIWYQTRQVSPVTAYMLMQIIMVLAFVPSYRRSTQFDRLEGKFRERQRPLAWILAVIAYVCMLIAILLDPKGFKLWQLVQPIVPGIIGNGIIVYLAYWQKRQLTHLVPAKQ